MAKEEKLFSVQAELNDGDFEDVFQIYMKHERGSERKYGLMTGIVLFVVFIILLICFRKITFLIYGIASLVIGFSYFKVPVNRKFLANNKLQLGEKRETVFYQHSVTSEEIFEEDYEDDEESVTKISTLGIKAYENERGFLFADVKILNQFLYLPKRCLSEEEIEQVRNFAQDNCSGGYTEVQAAAAGSEKESDGSITDAACSQYYGASNLHLYDENGQRIREEDEKSETPAPERIEAPELDVDAEWEKIISEDEDEEGN